MPVRSLLQAFALVLLFSSCGNVRDLEITGVRGFAVNQISTAGIDADLLVAVKNPNRFSFSLFPSTFNVKYSGVDLGQARLAKKVRISGNSEEVYKFNVKSDFRETSLADIMNVLKGATFRNELEINGDLKAGKFFYRKSLPVQLKERISLR